MIDEQGISFSYLREYEQMVRELLVAHWAVHFDLARYLTPAPAPASRTESDNGGAALW